MTHGTGLEESGEVSRPSSGSAAAPCIPLGIHSSDASECLSRRPRAHVCLSCLWGPHEDLCHVLDGPLGLLLPGRALSPLWSRRCPGDRSHWPPSPAGAHSILDLRPGAHHVLQLPEAALSCFFCKVGRLFISSLSAASRSSGLSEDGTVAATVIVLLPLWPQSLAARKPRVTA